MRSIDNLVIGAVIKKNQIKDSLVKKMTSKEHGDSQLVVALVLIVVAVGLCLLFRTQIKNIMNNIFTSTGEQVNNLLTEPTT